ncbi:unnamed protein product [Lasius platythorax]|uniref:PSI domain-containing protein n=1 Tax=Lasius platythorax TaxID=488582 RepID=A0AAV2NI56_9HYME
MAREEERWCFFFNGKQRPMRIPLLLLVLCALLVGSLTVVAEHDDSYYNYAGWKGKCCLSPLDHRSLEIRLIDGENVARIRRQTSDKSVVTTEQKDEPAKDQPSSQPQQQQPQQQQQQAPQLATTTNTTNTSHDVKYLSAYSTSEASVQFRTADAVSTVQPLKDTDVTSVPKPESKKKVTQPVKIDDVAAVHVWPNRTLPIRNVTSKKQPSADSKSNNPTKETELAKDATSGAENGEKPDDISEISISTFSDVMLNPKLTQNNITKRVYDTHQYYNSTFFIDDENCHKYWVNMDNHPDLRVNNLLSQSHRRAATVKLKFDFPFYGYNVRNITITTGGFLYTGVNSWLTAYQYIAPLMANFDNRLSNTSYVKYADNGTAFTVEWEKVVLRDRPKAGAFTFQVTLHQNGDIVFVYSVIPLMIERIEDTMHPVKIGLSDPYIIDRTVFLRRKTIYEYHRVNFNRYDIMNCTVIYLSAMPTCLNFDNCRDCLTKETDFDCKWCPELNKCSTGTSRQRQEWLLKGCDVRNIKEADNCPAQITTYKGEEYDHDGYLHPEEAITANEISAKQERPGTSPLESTNYSVIRLIDGENVARIRRQISEKSVVTTEQKDEPAKDQPSLQPQQQQPQQQQQQQQAPQLATTSNTTNTSHDVKYLSAYSTSEASVQFRTADAVSTVQPLKDTDVTSVPKPDSKKKVTQPVKIDDVATVHVWPNRTLPIRNVTKEQPSADSKSNNQTKETELAKDATSGAENGEKSDDIGDISISKFSDMTLNTTLTQNNITKTVYDTHQYYNSTFIIDAEICNKYWVDMDNHPDLRVNNLLSQSHRRAATVKLKFDFPFYGYNVRNITIATGGFLYTGDYVHSWLAATQYIAPLMANFDTRLSNTSYVKYADNGTAFTVEWEKVVLQDRPEAGAFTFQVTLHQNGDIVFVYSVIPLMIERIEDTMHPVKVGLSDAYIMDRTVFFVRRKTIYEYHRVNFNRQDIMNCTVIYLRALPTCLNFDNCRDCLTKVPDFDCKWCPELNKCSTGTSRQRQEWLLKGCDVRNIKEADNCPAQITTYKGEEYDHDGHVHPEEPITANEMSAKQERPAPNKMNMGVSGVIGILTVVALVAGLAAWGAYAYRNPHSASGQMLIRYRPSQWSWRRGEARYTAATIHM